jgi:alginate O-acetyltransferase complex protein AlgI
VIFNSWSFVFFFVIVWAVHWRLRSQNLRHIWLLSASYLFYGWWDWHFLGLIIAVSLLAYGAALLLVAVPAQKKAILWVAITGMLAVLGVFKYYNFFIAGLMPLLVAFGVHHDILLQNVILPVGISFYVFQSISYVVDVSSGRIDADRSVIRVMLYIAFFPQLVAGPIVRAAQFFPQLGCFRHFSKRSFYWGMRLVLLGLVYKILIADNLTPFIDPVFDNISNYDRMSLIGALVGFHVKIYFDFAGYSTIAIGVAYMLGFHLPRNFKFPYSAANPTDFWRRWHISLSQWFRDYLFIPLGGRGSGFAVYSRNLMLTMVLAGLWHGAAVGFVLWGCGHGLLLIAHKFVLAHKIRRAVPRIMSFAFTQLCVLVLWSGFRLSDLDSLMVFWTRVVGADHVDGGERLLGVGSICLFLVPLVADHVMGTLRVSQRIPIVPAPLFWLLCGMVVALIFLAYPVQSPHFIYFQF